MSIMIPTNEAMNIANVTRATIITWIKDFKIGNKQGGRWFVYKDGLQLILSGKLHYSYKYRKDSKKINMTYDEYYKGVHNND